MILFFARKCCLIREFLLITVSSERALRPAPSAEAKFATRPRRQRGSEETPSSAGDVAGARCMGRSRGGLTMKIHALVDANSLPILLKLTPGQAHDGRSAADMLDGLGQGQILWPTAATTATPCERASPEPWRRATKSTTPTIALSSNSPPYQ